MEQGERGRALAGGRSSERHGWSFERDPGGVGHEETESGRKKKQRRGEEIRSKVWGLLTPKFGKEYDMWVRFGKESVWW
jgi:hypothetical protein